MFSKKYCYYRLGDGVGAAAAVAAPSWTSLLHDNSYSLPFIALMFIDDFLSYAYK
jgi:hypothetical protein